MSQKKLLQAALAVLLISCTAAPPPNTSRLTTESLAVKSKPQPNQSTKPKLIQKNLNLPKALLDSAKAQLRPDGNGDSLALQVYIRKPAFRTQSIDVNSITHLRGWVKGPGIPNQVLNENNFVLVSENGESSLTIKRVIRGKNRVVTVRGYSQDSEDNTVPGAELKAFYSSPADSTEVVVYFTWRSTAAASILEELLAQNPELAETLDMTALQQLVDDLIQYDPDDNTSVTHPFRLNTEQIAADIIAANGSIPDHTPGVEIPAPWLLPGGSVEVVIQNPQGEAFNSPIVLQISDPASSVVEIGSGSDRGTVANIVPGTWEAIATLPGLNGGVQGRVTVVVDELGNVTLEDNLGTDGNPLGLPPVITALDQTTAATGETITLTGDGFDPVAGNNTVKFGNVVAEVISASETSLVVKVPAEIEGEVDITVTTDDKTSNLADFTVEKAVIALNKPGGSAGEQVTITVSGFNPETSNPTVQFNGSNQILTPDSVTSTTITVTVPADATTGPITVTPQDDQGLLSPEYVIDAALVSEIPEAAAVGQEITVKGANLTGATAITVNGVSVTTFNVVDDNTIVLTVPTGATTGPIAVTTPQGNASSVESLKIIDPPTISNVTPLNEETLISASNPMTITGTNYTYATEVKIGGVALDPSDYTIVNDTTIQVTNIPDAVSTGAISVTNPGGTATFSQNFAVYSDVINYIGPSSYTFYSVNNSGQITVNNGSVPVITDTNNSANGITSFSSLHGINTDFGSDLNDPTEYNIYVTTLNHRIFKFNQDGQKIWQAGTGTAALNTSVEVSLSSATFTNPEDTTNDWDGNVYVADTGNNAIRKITPDGRVITLARVWGPEGVEVSPHDGYLYITSNKPDNNPTSAWVVRIKDLDTLPPELEGTVDPNTVAIPDGKAGTSNVEIIAGGPVTGAAAAEDSEVALADNTAIFDHLEGLGMDGDGNIYVADVDVKQVRKLDLNANKITVFVTLNNPAFTMHEIRVDLAGNLFLPAPNNLAYGCIPFTFACGYAHLNGSPGNAIFKIAPDGSMNVVAGRYLIGSLEGDPVVQATFNDPRGIDIAPDGSLYVADNGWGVRKVERFRPINNIPPKP